MCMCVDICVMQKELSVFIVVCDCLLFNNIPLCVILLVVVHQLQKRVNPFQRWSSLIEIGDRSMPICPSPLFVVVVVVVVVVVTSSSSFLQGRGQALLQGFQ